MTIEKIEMIEPSSITHYSNTEILDIFKGVGQLEIPTREQVMAAKSGKTSIKEIKHRPRYIVQNRRKTPSKSYLTNLNPRIAKADTLWHNLWGRERGELLRYCGLREIEITTGIINDPTVPECVINKFISGAM